jgi:hypothetical protein
MGRIGEPVRSDEVKAVGTESPQPLTRLREILNREVSDGKSRERERTRIYKSTLGLIFSALRSRCKDEEHANGGVKSKTNRPAACGQRATTPVQDLF